MASRKRDKFGLTEQQRRFADEYLISENGAASYRKVYKGVSVKSADVISCQTN
ncbi:terminase small subunit [Thermodesulfobacteriota bacterium]